jgi:hypothetical protein
MINHEFDCCHLISLDCYSGTQFIARFQATKGKMATTEHICIKHYCPSLTELSSLSTYFKERIEIIHPALATVQTNNQGKSHVLVKFATDQYLLLEIIILSLCSRRIKQIQQIKQEKHDRETAEERRREEEYRLFTDCIDVSLVDRSPIKRRSKKPRAS